MNESVYPYEPVEPRPERPAPVPLEAPFGPVQWNEWARNSLFERRTVLLDGPLTEPLATRVASELTLLDSDSDEPIALRVDSSGGDLDAALTLVDVIGLLGAPVHATVVGRAEGASLAVVAVCARRLATPHARLRFGDDPTQAEGPASDVVAAVERRRERVRALSARLAGLGPLDADAIEDMIMRRAVVSLDDAVAWGLLDGVAEPEARVLRMPRPVGYRPPR